MNVGRATMSLVTEIYQAVSDALQLRQAATFHMESIIRVLPGRISVGTIYAGFLARVLCSLQDPRHCFLQLWGEVSLDRIPQVVSKVPRTDEEDVDAVDLCDFFNLRRACQACQLARPMSDLHSQRLLSSRSVRWSRDSHSPHSYNQNPTDFL